MFRSCLTIFRVRCYRVRNITMCQFVQGIIVCKYILHNPEILLGTTQCTRRTFLNNYTQVFILSFN